jgi:hypothetical protein
VYLKECYSPAVSKDANAKDAGYAAVHNRKRFHEAAGVVPRNDSFQPVTYKTYIHLLELSEGCWL